MRRVMHDEQWTKKLCRDSLSCNGHSAVDTNVKRQQLSVIYFRISRTCAISHNDYEFINKFFISHRKSGISKTKTKKQKIIFYSISRFLLFFFFLLFFQCILMNI